MEIQRALEEFSISTKDQAELAVVNDLELMTAEAFELPEFTPKQRAIIECDEEKRILVEAGPGTGKTAVACSRVAQLIETFHVSSAKILLVSFTRTAVKELKDRIESFASDPVNVAGLKIVTLDSFTWQVVRGLGSGTDEDLFRSYDSNIQGFINMIYDAQEDLLDHLVEFEHVVIDESQDLVGLRAELCLALIGVLSEECGVTIFADSAQAIYGFTSDYGSGSKKHASTLVESIRGGESAEFDQTELNEIHRTSDENLTHLFAEGRKRLIGKKEGSTKCWKEMKALVRLCAHGEVGHVTGQDLDGKSDHLVLFRTRAEVLQSSSYLWTKGIAHKLRMSGIQARVHPWLARVFHSFEEDFIGPDDFMERWMNHVHEGGADDAFKLLGKFAGDRAERVRVRRIREMAGRDRPPLEFLVDESELNGSVLGTIHASKGREANTVHLMLPPDKFVEREKQYRLSGSELAEEERVLFVGATRARNILRVGVGVNLYASRLPSGRVFRAVKKYKNARQIEIGLSSDLDYSSLAAATRDIAEVESIQDWLWENRNGITSLSTEYDFELKKSRLVAEDGKFTICSMSISYVQDLFAVARKLDGLHRPSSAIKNLRMVGVTSVVIPEAERDNLHAPWRQSGILLAPVLSGFPLVFFNKWDRKS